MTAQPQALLQGSEQRCWPPQSLQELPVRTATFVLRDECPPEATGAGTVGVPADHAGLCFIVFIQGFPM